MLHYLCPRTTLKIIGFPVRLLLRNSFLLVSLLFIFNNFENIVNLIPWITYNTRTFMMLTVTYLLLITLTSVFIPEGIRFVVMQFHLSYYHCNVHKFRNTISP